MNNDLIWSNTSRIILLVLLQGLLFKELPGLSNEYIQLFIYPMVILLFPLDIAVPTIVFLSFLTGLFVDFFYASVGVHAAAATFSGYMRQFIIAAFEPRAGFGSIPIPNVNLNWFLRYAAIFYALHILFYFMVEAFTLVYIGTITLHSIAAWAISMVGVVLYMLIFNPKK